MRLPEPPRRAHLRAFWLAVSAMLGAIGAAAASWWSVPHPVAVPVTASIILAAAGVMATNAVRPVYRLWNALSRRAARAARPVVAALCYFVIFVIVGMGGTKLERGRSTASTSKWVKRSAGPHDRRAAGESWTAGYIGWARHTGNVWALVLLPFLIVLSMLTEDDTVALPVHIYTLF